MDRSNRRGRRRYETAKKASEARKRLAGWALLHALETFIAELLACRNASADDWIDQDHSPLGKWRHLKLVREGTIPGHKSGKKILIRREDLDEYLRKHAVQVKRTGASQPAERSLAPEDIAARTLAELGLELGGNDEG